MMRNNSFVWVVSILVKWRRLPFLLSFKRTAFSSSFTNTNPQKHYQHLLSLFLKHQSKRDTVQQLHSHLVTNGITQIILWNPLLRHYSLGVFPQEALLLYKYLLLLTSFSSFDSFTYSFLLKACANLCFPIGGSQLHSITVKAGFKSHVYVQTALVNMYSVCGSLVEATRVFYEMRERNSVTWNTMITGLIKGGQLNLARRLFDEMPTPDVISWTGIIDGYARMNHPKEALVLFHRMVVHEGVKPTGITFLAIFPAISNLGALENCQLLHTYGEKSGFNVSDIRVANSLIDVYAKCGCIESASSVFKDISTDRKNLVSWTSIISGFAMHGMAKEAIEYLEEMEKASLTPN